MNIYEVLRSRGYTTVPESFYSYIDLWKSWYEGYVKAFHRYRVWNGMKYVPCRLYSLGMAKKVCEDWANLLINEKVKITLEGTKEQEYIDEVFRRNNFWVKANEMQELKAARGTVAYVPRVVNARLNAETGEVNASGADIRIDYVTADFILPLTWENGIITECAFGSHKAIKDDTYLYVSIHRKTDKGTYDIENLIYKDTKGSLSEVNLTDVEGFENVAPVIHTAETQRMFVIDRLNISNNIDQTLPMGVSAFANAIDQLKGCDIAYDSYVNEFQLGKKRIMLKPQATKDFHTGEPLFDTNDIIFYVLPEDGEAGDLIREIDMHLRTAEHNAGIQDMLNLLSSKCGFGENHYKYNGGSVATATQIISENSEMFRTIKKHEIILDDVLKELCRVLLRMGNIYMNAGLNEDVEITVDFDDSIIEDKETDFSRDMRMMQMGIMLPWEFRAKWMNEDEQTARAALPQMENLVSENDAE